ncbi:MAG: cell division protein FtsA [Candidatus Omnitrophota bacterium]|nr:cell division protein FtsA [Candidatus Omnitrophota bacterium]
MMLKNNYLCALDIGSSKICACLARMKKKQVTELFFESVASRGVKEGTIVNSIDLVGAVSALMKSLKAKSGVNVSSVSVNVSGPDILTKHSRAIVPLAERGNKVITASDMHKAVEQARILGSSLEEEIIHQIPSSYTIDSKSNITNPLGLYSHSLEVDLYLICARLSSIQSITRVINQSGYDLKNLFFSGLATASAVFAKDFKDGANILCDIGSDTTQMLFFKSGILADIQILPMGGDSLTARLQEELKVPFELAEDIKRSHGVIGDAGQISEDKEILVKKSNFYKPIKQKLVSQIITPAARSLCCAVKEAAEKRTPLYALNNFVAAGRAMFLEGLIEMLENTLSIPVKIGRINNPAVLSLVKEDSALAGRQYLAYLTAIGMLCETLDQEQEDAVSELHPQNPLLKAVSKFKEAYQEYF